MLNKLNEQTPHLIILRTDFLALDVGRKFNFGPNAQIEIRFTVIIYILKKLIILNTCQFPNQTLRPSNHF